MLNHEPTEQGQSALGAAVPASDRRVTTEEFTQAVTALEAKREEVTKDLKGTVSIGATARELELEATPEEIWAEVQAQRRRAETVSPDAVTAPASALPASVPPTPSAPAPPPLHQTVATSLRDAAVAAAPGLRDAASAAKPALQQGVHAVSDFVAQQKQIRKENKSKKRQGREFGAAFGVIGLTLFIAFNHEQTPTHHVSSAPIPIPVAERLTSVPDGQTFSVDMATLEAIEHKTAPTTQMVYAGQLNNGWKLIKYQGKVYVRGYILPMSDEALKSGTVRIYNDPDAGVLHDVDDDAITLPLDGIHIDSTDYGDDWNELDVSHIQPDDHMREDW